MENIHTQELLDKLGELLESMDYDEDPEGKWNNDEIKYTKVKETGWDDQGKRAYKTEIFKFPELFPETDIYVQAELGRTGDYYQGYEYEETIFSFVKHETRTIVKSFYTVVNI